MNDTRQHVTGVRARPFWNGREDVDIEIVVAGPKAEGTRLSGLDLVDEPILKPSPPATQGQVQTTKVEQEAEKRSGLIHAVIAPALFLIGFEALQKFVERLHNQPNWLPLSLS